MTLKKWWDSLSSSQIICFSFLFYLKRGDCKAHFAALKCWYLDAGDVKVCFKHIKYINNSSLSVMNAEHAIKDSFVALRGILLTLVV